jgi:predicted acetyltransferase
VSERFRWAEEGEIGGLARLVSHSFPGTARGPGWWEERLRQPPYGGGADIVLVAEVDGDPAAALQLHPLRTRVAGREHRVAGVGSVAVSPLHRRRGLAARLVAEGLRRSRERGDSLSALYPFRISFYRRLGFGAAGTAEQYRLPPAAFPYDPAGPRVQRVVEDADRAELDALYGRWMRNQTGQVVRTPAVWEQVLGQPDRVAVLYRAPDGEPRAYCVAQYRADAPAPERHLEVEEQVWTSPEGQRAIYGWLATLGDQWREILYRAHPDEHLALRLADPRLPSGSAPGWGLWAPFATLLNGPMYRILDLPAAWGGRPAAGEGIVMALEVRDEQLPENAGAWRVRLGPDGSEAERGGGAADIRLTLDVSVLSSLFVSGCSPSAAVAAGLAGVDRPEILSRLDAALRLPSPWTFDRF